MKKSVDRLAEAKVQNITDLDPTWMAQAAAGEGYIRPEDQKRLLAFGTTLGRELDPEVSTKNLRPLGAVTVRKGVVSP